MYTSSTNFMNIFCDEVFRLAVNIMFVYVAGEWFEMRCSVMWKWPLLELQVNYEIIGALLQQKQPAVTAKPAAAVIVDAISSSTSSIQWKGIGWDDGRLEKKIAANMKRSRPAID